MMMNLQGKINKKVKIKNGAYRISQWENSSYWITNHVNIWSLWLEIIVIYFSKSKGSYNSVWGIGYANRNGMFKKTYNHTKKIKY